GQSLGKKVFGIKVVKLTGEAANLNDYILRWSFRMIDIYFSLGTVASLMIGSSPKHQRLGDLLGDTAVIKVRSSFHLKLQDILKINSLENYEITYPDVRQFTEKEMLFIKNTVNRYQRYPNEAHRKAINELSYKMVRLLKLEAPPRDKTLFLKTLIRDYIVLTR
ncbi:MAG: RDD family protein, partial [Bacteroidota bacterium]